MLRASQLQNNRAADLASTVGCLSSWKGHLFQWHPCSEQFTVEGIAVRKLRAKFTEGMFENDRRNHLQQAIDTTFETGGGVVAVPSGLHRTGMLRLHDCAGGDFQNISCEVDLGVYGGYQVNGQSSSPSPSSLAFTSSCPSSEGS